MHYINVATCFDQLYGHLQANFMLSEWPEDEQIGLIGRRM